MAQCFGSMTEENYQACQEVLAEYGNRVAAAKEELMSAMLKAFTAGQFYEMQKAPGYPLGKLIATDVFERWVSDESLSGRLFSFISKVAAGMPAQVEAKKLIEDCAAWHADQHATDLVAQWEDE